MYKMSLKYVSYGLGYNMAALAQILAWRRTGNVPLSEPMFVRYTYIRHSASIS